MKTITAATLETSYNAFVRAYNETCERYNFLIANGIAVGSDVEYKALVAISDELCVRYTEMENEYFS